MSIRRGSLHLERVDDLGDPSDGNVMREFDNNSTPNDPDRGRMRCLLRTGFFFGFLADDERAKTASSTSVAGSANLPFLASRRHAES